MKQNTSLLNILHCIKLITAVCFGFVYKNIKNKNNNLNGEIFLLTQLWLLQQSRNSSHLRKPKGRWQL